MGILIYKRIRSKGKLKIDFRGTKMKQLEWRGKNYNVASAAGARELACFVWGMMNGRIA